MRRRSVLFLSVALLAGCGQQLGQAVKGVANVAAVDPDKAAIRQWLKENLDDPHFEEVKWIGPVSSDRVRDRAIAEIEQSIEADKAQLQQNPKWKDELQPLIEGNTEAIKDLERFPKYTAHYLKLRQKNLAGAKVLSEFAFMFRDGRLTALSYDDLVSDARTLRTTDLDPRIWFTQEKLREESPTDATTMHSIRHDLWVKSYGR